MEKLYKKKFKDNILKILLPIRKKLYAKEVSVECLVDEVERLFKDVFITTLRKQQG